MQNAKKAKKEALKTLSIAGHTIELSELKNDVAAAKAKGLSGQFAFTPETVEALIENLEEALSA